MTIRLTPDMIDRIAAAQLAAVIEYLEHDDNHREQSLYGAVTDSLIGIRRASYPHVGDEVRSRFSGIFADHPERHLDDLCDESPALCTGDGSRWMPGLPILRFT